MHTHLIETHVIERTHQVVIVDGLKLPDHIPSTMRRNSESVQQLYPEAKYHLWSGEELRTFIGDTFRYCELLIHYGLTLTNAIWHDFVFFSPKAGCTSILLSC
jgi:hypothetical protein